jgi:hypothetical protein
MDEMERSRLVYLAAPYTHATPEIRQARFEAVTRAAAWLVQKGRIVYSPITMTHPIDVVLAGEGATLGSEFWVKFDEAFMSVCAEIVVLRLEGWEHSSGVARELAFFRERGLPVAYIDPGVEIPNVPV